MEAQSVMLEDELNVVRPGRQDLVEGRTDPGAEGSLEVRYLVDNDYGVLRALRRRGIQV